VTRRETKPLPPRADNHQHLFSPDVTRLLASRTGGGVSPIDAANLIELLDAAGIERALVLSVAYLYGSPNRLVDDEYTRVQEENDWTLAQVARYRERLRGFCSFNPLRAYALEELARCAGTHAGVKLHLANSDVQLDVRAHVKRLQSVFAAADGYGMPVVVHLRASIGRNRPYGAAQARTFIDEVLPAAAHVCVQIAHLAGTGPGYDDPAADRALETFVDAIAAGDPRVLRVWFDVATLAKDGLSSEEAQRMAQRIRQIGTRRVLFGSDGAAGNPPPREAWAAFARLPLTDEDVAAVAGNVPLYLADDD
jgi:uncharacterized protein